jgi:hypothetical protein
MKADRKKATAQKFAAAGQKTSPKANWLKISGKYRQTAAKISPGAGLCPQYSGAGEQKTTISPTQTITLL